MMSVDFDRIPVENASVSRVLTSSDILGGSSNSIVFEVVGSATLVSASASLCSSKMSAISFKRNENIDKGVGF